MLFTSLLVGFASLACAQAPNTVSTIYPNLATMASNGSQCPTNSLRIACHADMNKPSSWSPSLTPRSRSS